MPKIYLLLSLSLWACQAPTPVNPQPTPSVNPSPSVVSSPTSNPSTKPSPSPVTEPSPSPSPSATPSPPSDSAEFKLGEAFSLALNQEKQAAAEAIRIKFVAVPADSRCPSGVNCIWAGEVKVKLALRKNQQAAEEKEILLSGGSESAQINWEGYTIELLEVAPYPKFQEDSREYQVKLLVTRAK